MTTYELRLYKKLAGHPRKSQHVATIRIEANGDREAEAQARTTDLGSADRALLFDGSREVGSLRTLA